MGGYHGGYGGGFGGGFGGANLGQLMKQAQKMQEDMQKQKEELDNKEFSSSIGGGQVELVMYGSKKIKSLKINPMVVDPDDVEMLEDLITAAFSDCLSQIEKEENSNMPNIPMGF